MTNEPEFKAELIHDISSIPAESWNICAGDNPFLNHAFLSALEQSECATASTGWHPFHIQLTAIQSGQIAAYMPLYIKSHSYGEYVFDHAWANAFEHAGGQYYPKLQSAVPFTPVTGARLLIHPEASPNTAQALLRVAKSITEQQCLSSLHITFLPEQQAQITETEGYLVRTDQQFFWKNQGYTQFEDFLEQLSSRKRKQIRKERRTALSPGIEIEQIEGGDITSQHWDSFYNFYLDTSAKKWGQPYLNKDFFTLIGKSMADQIVLMLCKRNGTYIAGALNFKSASTLYGRYWGCIEGHPNLHFETCYYQAIDYAIANGIHTVEAGAQGPHKLARGYTPTLTYSAHWIENPSLRNAVKSFLKEERNQVDAQVTYLSGHAPFKKQ